LLTALPLPVETVTTIAFASLLADKESFDNPEIQKYTMYRFNLDAKTWNHLDISYIAHSDFKIQNFQNYTILTPKIPFAVTQLNS